MPLRGLFLVSAVIDRAMCRNLGSEIKSERVKSL
jgi:hypothetical protein